MEKTNNSKFETTLADLVAAAGEMAFEFSDNDKDGYLLARLALIEMLKNSASRTDPIKEFESLPSPSPSIH
jgi:hypothetical protein